MRYVRHTAIALMALFTIMIPVTSFGAAKVPALREIRTATALSGSERTIIVSGTLSNDDALPGTIVLPIPKGTSPVWVGQVVGSDPSLDPTATYSITKGKDYDLIAINVDKSRTAQAEFIATVPASKDGVVPLSLKLPIIGSVKEATIEFWVAKGSVVASTSAGVALTTSGSSSYDIYARSKSSPKQGSVFKGSVNVSTSGASAPSTGGTTGGASGGSTASASPGAGTSWQGLLGLALVIGVAGSVGFVGVNSVMALNERKAAGSVTAPAPVKSAQKPSASQKSSRRSDGPTSSTTRKPPSQPTGKGRSKSAVLPDTASAGVVAEKAVRSSGGKKAAASESTVKAKPGAAAKSSGVAAKGGQKAAPKPRKRASEN